LLDRIENGEEAVVRAYWPLELANALLVAYRRKRVTADQISEFIEDLAALPIRLEPPSSPAQWPAGFLPAGFLKISLAADYPPFGIVWEAWSRGLVLRKNPQSTHSELPSDRIPNR
jgi:hypothetical protein